MNAFGRVHQDSLGLLLVKTKLEFRDLLVTGPKKVSSKSKKSDMFYPSFCVNFKMVSLARISPKIPVMETRLPI